MVDEERAELEESEIEDEPSEDNGQCDIAENDSDESSQNPINQPMFELLKLPNEEINDDRIKAIVYRQIKYDIKHNTSIPSNYQLLFLYDKRPINRYDADKIYDVVTETKKDKKYY